MRVDRIGRLSRFMRLRGTAATWEGIFDTGAIEYIDVEESAAHGRVGTASDLEKASGSESVDYTHRTQRSTVAVDDDALFPCSLSSITQ